MYRIFKISLAPLILVISACSSSSDSATEALEIVTISGNVISLNGAYESCYEFNMAPGSSEKYSLNFSGNIMSVEQTTHLTTNCTGPSSGEDFTITAKLSKGQTSSLIGWVDHNDDTIDPPVAADGSGMLSNTESITLINAIITESNTVEDIGISFELFFVVDDTGTTQLLYLDDDSELTGRFAVANTPVTKL